MKRTFDRILTTPWIAHVMRAVQRFGNRLGSQFAAAITYFSVLAVVPILMFSFAVVGLTLVELKPELMDVVKRQVLTIISDASAKQNIEGLIDKALRSWATVGIVGLVTALYAGLGWVGNLKQAVRAQWRPEFDIQPRQGSPIKDKLQDLATFVGLLLIGGAVLFAGNVGTTLTQMVLRWLRIAETPLAYAVARIASFLLATFLGWLLFVYIYRFFPAERPGRTQLHVGSLIAALGLGLLQMLSGVLFSSFASNPTAAVFGTLIVVMLFLNLLATLILLVAAWIATWDQPAVARVYSAADEPLRKLKPEDVEMVPGHWEAADADKARKDKEKAEKERAKKGEAPQDRPESAKEAWAAQRGRQPQGPSPVPEKGMNSPAVHPEKKPSVGMMALAAGAAKLLTRSGRSRTKQQ